MNLAEEWVRKHSRADASARSLMFALAHLGRGSCRVRFTAAELMREARISRPHLYRCFAMLEELGEVERLMEHHEKKRFREIHLAGFCKSHSLIGKCPVSYRKHGQVSDLRRTSLIVSSLLPFPRICVSQEECEECRGSGYRDFTIIAHDGQPQRVAIPCTHEIAAIAGRWRPVETWQDQFVRFVLPRAPNERGAEQLTLAEFQERLRRDELRRQREKILEEHPEEAKTEEEKRRTNVVVMRRKTA